MGAAKNIFSGMIQSIVALATFIVVPWLGLTAVKTLDLGASISIQYFRDGIDDILFYIISIGLVMCALAFAKGSSPKYSKRKPVFSLLYLFGAACYSYIIKYTGLSRVPITLVGYGDIVVNLDAFVYFVFGIVVINSILTILDLIIVIADQRREDVYSLDEERKATMIAAEQLGVKVE
ncbi:MAG: hypothetical protein GYA24_19350 [Candidatus Lokiarchaeota archaeon]|nr:hypothetical protein [Candidatus Lokiarchaeota archaeon]